LSHYIFIVHQYEEVNVMNTQMSPLQRFNSNELNRFSRLLKHIDKRRFMYIVVYNILITISAYITTSQVRDQGNYFCIDHPLEIFREGKSKK
jgi:hypothetical protein